MCKRDPAIGPGPFYTTDILRGGKRLDGEPQKQTVSKYKDTEREQNRHRFDQQIPQGGAVILAGDEGTYMGRRNLHGGPCNAHQEHHQGDAAVGDGGNGHRQAEGNDGLGAADHRANKEDQCKGHRHRDGELLEKVRQDAHHPGKGNHRLEQHDQVDVDQQHRLRRFPQDGEQLFGPETVQQDLRQNHDGGGLTDRQPKADDEQHNRDQGPEISEEADQVFPLLPGIHRLDGPGGNFPQVEEKRKQVGGGHGGQHAQHKQAGVLVVDGQGQKHRAEGGEEHLRDMAVITGDKQLLFPIQGLPAGLVHHLGTDRHHRGRRQKSNDGGGHRRVDPVILKQHAERFLGVAQPVTVFQHLLQECDQVKTHQYADVLQRKGLLHQHPDGIAGRNAIEHNRREDASPNRQIQGLFGPDQQNDDGEHQTQTDDFSVFHYPCLARRAASI